MDMNNNFLFFTHKIDVDKAAIDLMRPLLDGGLIIESFCNLIKELYFKKYSRLAIQREHSVTKRKNEILSNADDREIFSSFSDCLNHIQVLI